MKRSKHSATAAAALLAAALLLSFASGCNEILAELDGEPIGAPKPPPKQAEDSGAAPQSPQARLERYYEDQRRSKRKASVDPENVIVTCALPGEVIMTRKFDCQSRGGTIR